MGGMIPALQEAWTAASAAPSVFMSAAVALIGGTLGLTRLHYTAVIERRDAEIRLLKERLETPREVKGQKLPAQPDLTSAPVRRFRETSKRVVEAIESERATLDVVSNLTARVAEMTSSTHSVWLNDDLRRARRDLVDQWELMAKVWARTSRDPERGGRGYFSRNEIEQAEMLHAVRDAALRLEAGLTGKPVPAPVHYGTD